MPDRRLVLFEDEGDDAKIEELKKFLEGFTWDGENNGIIIWLNVTVGDTIVIGEDGGIHVEKKVVNDPPSSDQTVPKPTP